MYINPDELDEELALEKLSLKRASPKNSKKEKELKPPTSVGGFLFADFVLLL